MLYSKLKQARKKTGLTQVQVANKAEISESAYQNYEYGERVPDVHTAQKLANALGESVEDLFPLPSEKTSPSEITHQNISTN